MKLLYSYPSLSCTDIQTRIPQAEIKRIHKKQIWSIPNKENKLLFITKGKIRLLGIGDEKIFADQKMLIIPEDVHVKCIAVEDSTIIIFKLAVSHPLCTHCIRIAEYKEEDINENTAVLNFTEMDIKPKLKMYLDSLEFYIEEGLKCIYFYDNKLKELYYLLNKYYTEDEIFNFFSPLLTFDTQFKNMVIHNYHKVKTAKELASLMNYSLSGFEKHFKKIFNLSPGQWMKQMRANSIYNEIKTTPKSLKEICDNYQFYSPAHLNDYCKKHFGETPGNIRRSKTI